MQNGAKKVQHIYLKQKTFCERALKDLKKKEKKSRLQKADQQKLKCAKTRQSQVRGKRSLAKDLKSSHSHYVRLQFQMKIKHFDLIIPNKRILASRYISFHQTHNLKVKFWVCKLNFLQGIKFSRFHLLFISQN